MFPEKLIVVIWAILTCFLVIIGYPQELSSPWVDSFFVIEQALFTHLILPLWIIFRVIALVVHRRQRWTGDR